LKPVLEPARRNERTHPVPAGLFGRVGLWLKENF
jgi:hypothetical protein